ncbi:hypothetical protein [Amycolatopsis magusensis]|uniref:Drug/metabolite transporter (DMT)-like permease n=1 Tax=Amycolatopsis magusensis TaxID=882444 RepID=A0ABS4PUV0_9PSEU|nr:hypothetical protein [Amycolatopsis magusensis]MBP2182618.1 drug/metabolite transporter (DMT)-like permease [Amycolatopsis magusensis]MDI5982500.1 hypothetical protein [Amycolatopsis magusensis]
MLGYLILALCTAMYALGIVAQGLAARRTGDRVDSRLGFLARLLSDPLYLLGFAGQAGGFVLAYFARASLPLYLVQAGSSAAVGVAAIFGAVVLGWRLRRLEVGVLVVMACGLVLLAGSSETSQAREISPELGVLLLAVLLACAAAVVYLSRSGPALLLAVLAGVAFSMVAIISRAVADQPLLEVPLHPLAWLMVLSAVVGQAALALALRTGSVTSMVASMDATTVVLASVTGIAALGDRIAAGRQWWVTLGLALVVAGVLALGTLRETRTGVAVSAG